MMHRRKPFSHKQKKEQLKAKRRQNTDEQESSSDLSESEVTALTTEKSRTAGFVRVFLPETTKSVEEAKIDSTRPFDRPVKPFNNFSLFLDPQFCPNLPRRPHWDESTTAEELHQREEQSFAEWLIALAENTENNKLTYAHMSYFETNLEAYRQFWRSTERADVVCIVTDIRAPIAHVPRNVVDHITNHLQKPFVLAFNKCDLVDNEHIVKWKEFIKIHLPTCKDVFLFGKESMPTDIDDIVPSHLDETQRFVEVTTSMFPHLEEVTVTMIGQPSVGKSSLMNRLVGKKVTATKRTPGTTKHLQTYYLVRNDEQTNVLLCDCPGIVFPIKTLCRPLQVITGVVPLGRTREFFSSFRFLCEHADGFLEQLNVDVSKEWSPMSLLEELANRKGFLTKGGGFDVYRVAQMILRDLIDGKLSYQIAPF
ncbi:hypothetical protein RCL1_004359 [Eukaryota sp. TZLM3-RCL]